MEKHTIQDGLIPLSGLSPLVVCRQWGKLTTKVEALNVIKPNIDCTILVVIPVASFETNSRSEPYPLMYATPLGSSMRIIADVDGSRSQDSGLPVDVFWFAIGTN